VEKDTRAALGHFEVRREDANCEVRKPPPGETSSRTDYFDVFMRDGAMGAGSASFPYGTNWPLMLDNIAKPAGEACGNGEFCDSARGAFASSMRQHLLYGLNNTRVRSSVIMCSWRWLRVQLMVLIPTERTFFSAYPRSVVRELYAKGLAWGLSLA